MRAVGWRRRATFVSDWSKMTTDRASSAAAGCRVRTGPFRTVLLRTPRAEHYRRRRRDGGDDPTLPRLLRPADASCADHDRRNNHIIESGYLLFFIFIYFFFIVLRVRPSLRRRRHRKTISLL